MGSKISISLGFLLFPLSLLAQPGGTWKKTELVCKHCRPYDLSFCDTNTGFIIVYPDTQSIFPHSIAFSTHDGGNSFTELDSIKGFPKAFCLLPGLWEGVSPYYISNYSTEATYYSTDSGQSWQNNVATEYGNLRNIIMPYVVIPIAVSGSGNSLQLVSATPSGPYYFAISLDSGLTFYPFGDTLTGLSSSPSFGYCISGLSVLLYGIQNSVTGWYWRIGRSTDGGANWSYYNPIDTSNVSYFYIHDTIRAPLIQYEEILPGYDAGHLFLMGGRLDSATRLPIDDYLESTDSGIIWHEVRNIAGGRVQLIASPALNVLWAVVRHPPVYSGHYYGLGFADSIFHSTDGGLSWAKDGNTFQGDTIVSMKWIGANNGYVLTYRDSSTYLYRYSLDEFNYVASTDSAVVVDFYPNPVQNFLILPARTDTVAILDVLGHSRVFERSGNTLDISALPPGVYFVSDGRGRAKFVKE